MHELGVQEGCLRQDSSVLPIVYFANVFRVSFAIVS